MAKDLLKELEKVINKHIRDIVKEELKKEFGKKDVKANSKAKKVKTSEKKPVIVNPDKDYTDLFGNTCKISELTVDHIYPTSLDGSKNKLNTMRMCLASNRKKNNDLEGEVNGKKFLIKEWKKDGKGLIVGQININTEGKQFETKSTQAEQKRFKKESSSN